MAYDLADIGERLTKLERKVAALHARHGVASAAANFTLTALEVGSYGDVGPLRAALLEKLKADVHAAGLSEHANRAALEEIAQFDALSHASGPSIAPADE